MKNHQSTYQSCRDYPATTISRLLELPSDSADRCRWETHAGKCPACRNILEADRKLVDDIVRIPDPAPALIRAAVMSRVRSQRNSRMFRRGDFAWGASGAFAGVVLGMVLVWNGSSPVQTAVSTDSGTEMASLTVADDFDTFIADLALSQKE